MKTKLAVYVDNDDALLIWTVDVLDPSCTGFAVQRRLNHGAGWLAPTWLDNWVPPSPKVHPTGEHHPSNEQPFRCLSWTDHSVVQGDKVRYRVIPVGGSGDLAESSGSNWSPPRTIGEPTSTPFEAFFNRGFVISQFMSRYLDGKYPGLSRVDVLAAFKKNISDDDESKIRAFLAGLVLPRLLGLLNDAKSSGGHVYAALFEISDGELLSALSDLGDHAHVVLSNGSIQAKRRTKTQPAEPVGQARLRDENAAARQHLAHSGVDVELSNRFIAPSPLGHNKFMVVTDANGTAETVWTGSTNWTPTGLCTQLNNALVCSDPGVAAAYLSQWRALRAAQSAHPVELSRSNSSPTLVGTEAQGHVRTAVHFTRTQNHADLDALAEVVKSTRHGILFLMFMPGAKGVLSYIHDLAAKEPDLVVRGVVSTLPQGPRDEHTGEKATLRTTLVGVPQLGTKTQTFEVVQPESMAHVAAGWATETTREQFLSNIGFAIIHSKVLVVDPFSEDPTVVTGSHNFSLSASEDNDENFVIVKGDRALAEAYAVNIDSTWRHYAHRLGNPHPTLFGTAYLQALLDDQTREWEFWKVS